MSARRNLSSLKVRDRVRERITGRRGEIVLAHAPWLKIGEVLVKWADSGLTEQVVDDELFRTHKALSRKRRRKD